MYIWNAPADQNSLPLQSSFCKSHKLSLLTFLLPFHAFKRVLDIVNKPAFSPAYILNMLAFYNLSGSGSKRALGYPAGEVWWRRMSNLPVKKINSAFARFVTLCALCFMSLLCSSGNRIRFRCWHANDTFHLNLENLWDAIGVCRWPSSLPRGHGKKMWTI